MVTISLSARNMTYPAEQKERVTRHSLGWMTQLDRNITSDFSPFFLFCLLNTACRSFVHPQITPHYHGHHKAHHL